MPIHVCGSVERPTMLSPYVHEHDDDGDEGKLRCPLLEIEYDLDPELPLTIIGELRRSVHHSEP